MLFPYSEILTFPLKRVVFLQGYSQAQRYASGKVSAFTAKMTLFYYLTSTLLDKAVCWGDKQWFHRLICVKLANNQRDKLVAFLINVIRRAGKRVEVMDKFDERIIELLKYNARISISDIAREVNLSRSAVTARIRKLEQDKVILGYHANLAASETADKVCAYFALQFDSSASLPSCERYAEQLYQIPGIKWCDAISGETDLMLYVEVESMVRLNAIRDELQRNPQLRSLRTHTVLKAFFNSTKA